MADFNEAMAYVYDNEKGYSDRATDKGGPTNLGVTMALWSKWIERQATVDDMKSLTRELTDPMYKKWFWDFSKLGEILDQAIATAIMDESVNNGPGNAVKLAQLASGIPRIDGVLGSNSVAWINKIPYKNFFGNYLPLLQEHYIDIAIKDPAELPNLKGWLHRSQKLITLL
jgi:type VI secretion system secreted protein VgrG